MSGYRFLHSRIDIVACVGAWVVLGGVVSAQQASVPAPAPTPVAMPSQTLSREEDLQAKREKLRAMVERRKMELAREAEKNRLAEQQAIQQAAQQQAGGGAVPAAG
jgi:hypothetical protein